jgi:hypothetical protein
MIGVAVHWNEREVVGEFFEMFKTPWEFCRKGGAYEALICTGTPPPGVTARVCLVFASAQGVAASVGNEPAAADVCGRSLHLLNGGELPVYGNLKIFADAAVPLLWDSLTGCAVAHVCQDSGQTVLHVGYSLFEEVKHLLTQGQPAQFAGVPTLDEHVHLLRSWLLKAGVPLMEVLPSPAGYPFIGCLTHDVDHPSLRAHGLDFTLLGFLYRATVKTAVDVFTRKREMRVLRENLHAVFRLPLVYLRRVPDFWNTFHLYQKMEEGAASTFFVIPQKGLPGRTLEGNAPALRACRYDFLSLIRSLKRLQRKGGEVGVHGVDAWLDEESGRCERQRVQNALGGTKMGIRMHWLYWQQNSPRLLEEAGFDYDSTFGYCETVGFRGGTLQAYVPPGAEWLVELPLHVMDTALFYPAYLNLRESEAQNRVFVLLNQAAHFGGVLTFNWHDRSIAPERLWDTFYVWLLADLKRRGAWLTNAANAVAWFRKRRGVVFNGIRFENGRWHGHVSVAHQAKHLPSLILRVYKPQAPSFQESAGESTPINFVDQKLEESMELEMGI